MGAGGCGAGGAGVLAPGFAPGFAPPSPGVVPGLTAPLPGAAGLAESDGVGVGLSSVLGL